MSPTRRHRLILLAVLLLVLPLGVVAWGGRSEAPTTSTALAPSTTTTVTSTPAKKVLLLGDSSMVDASPALIAMFNASGAQVAMGAIPGYGLTQVGMSMPTSPFRSDWVRLRDQETPDLVVVMLGLWDQHFVEVNGVATYSRIVTEAADILTAKGAKVLWLSLPPGGKAPERIQDPAFEAVAAMYPGKVFYTDTEGSLRGPNGDFPARYVAPDGSLVHLRKADGWHFCPDGAERLADAVDRVSVNDGLTVPAMDGWQNGPWRVSSLYDEPACSQ